MYYLAVLHIQIATLSRERSHEIVSKTEGPVIIYIQHSKTGVQERGDVSPRPSTKRNHFTLRIQYSRSNRHAMRPSMKINNQRQRITFIRHHQNALVLGKVCTGFNYSGNTVALESNEWPGVIQKVLLFLQNNLLIQLRPDNLKIILYDAIQKSNIFLHSTGRKHSEKESWWTVRGGNHCQNVVSSNIQLLPAALCLLWIKKYLCMEIYILVFVNFLTAPVSVSIDIKS